MESLKIETAEFNEEYDMRCQGMCQGSCSCPTGHCKCKMVEDNSLEAMENENHSSDSELFKMT